MTEEQNTCTFFKKSGRKSGAGRKRQQCTPSDDDESDEESSVIKRDRKHVKGALYQTSSTGKVKNLASAGTSDSEEDGAQQEQTLFSYKSKKTAESEGPADLGATATLQSETEHSRDARAVFERARNLCEELKGKEEDNKYRGQKGYAQYVKSRDTAQGSAANKKGPIRAPDFLRATTRWDYQPDICKDYKETGYCGFGDSCKFLHDRSDYKSGWQLEKEWKDNAYGKEDITQYEIHGSDSEEELPFACYICREFFKNPVVTKCKHYFCESCALKNYRKSSRCVACNQQTGGIFNPAKDVISKIRKIEEEKRKKTDEELLELQ